MKKFLFVHILLFVFLQSSFAQNKKMESKSSIDIDEIEVTVKSVSLSSQGDTAIVELLLQSYLREPRELKINTFSSGVIGPDGKLMFYDMMSMGKVRLLLSSRQNYLHYLLNRDNVVPFVIKTPNWQKRWGKPAFYRLTLEDHLDEGKFIQVDIPL